MLPVGKIVPEILLEADRIDSFVGECLLKPRCGILIRQIERQKGCRISIGIRDIPESNALAFAKDIFDSLFIFFLLSDNRIKLPQLGKAKGALKFVHAVIESQNRPTFKGPADIGVMVMAVIVVPLGTEVKIFIISEDHSPFARG